MKMKKKMLEIVYALNEVSRESLAQKQKEIIHITLS